MICADKIQVPTVDSRVGHERSKMTSWKGGMERDESAFHHETHNIKLWL